MKKDEMRLSEASLEERLSFEKSILDSALDAIVTVDMKNIVLEWSPSAQEVFGYSREEILGKDLTILIPPEYHAGHRRGMDNFKKSGTGPILNKRIEIEAMNSKGKRFPIELTVSPFIFENEQYFTARIRDISQRIIDEKLQQSLIYELDHRVKNTLAIVMAMVRLTKFDNEKDYVRKIQNRISALEKVHSEVAENKWTGVSLEDIVTNQVTPFSSHSNFDIDGPFLIVKPTAAQAIGIVLHELCTNAIKYGSLSVKEGSVNISWEFQEKNVCFKWIEVNGPPILEAPKRKSFGMVMIETHLASILGQNVALSWNKEGLDCRFKIPFSHIKD